jgi:hypothetical protein
MSAICGSINISDKGLLKEMITTINYRGIYSLERVRSMITVALRCGNEKKHAIFILYYIQISKRCFLFKEIPPLYAIRRVQSKNL